MKPFDKHIRDTILLVCIYNMINKINKERRRSMNATPYDPPTRTNGKEPRRTPNKNRTGQKQSTDRLIIK
jgi:hypothetical protein